MLEIILISINLGFQILERIFKYTKKHTIIKSECMNNTLTIETEIEKNDKTN
jgi:hypothetical protein